MASWSFSKGIVVMGRTASLIRATVALLLTMMPAEAGGNQLFVSPQGSDAGQCDSNNPCGTIGRACGVANASIDRATSIKFAGGLYEHNTVCDVHYHRSVFVYAECDSRPEIVLSGNDIAFSAQDFAILTVSCVDIRSKGKGSNAFAARQFAIMDVQDVRIGRIEDGSALVAGEMSKINCLSGLVLYGDVGYVAQASGMSTVHLNCAFTFENTPRLHAIVLAVQRSFILAPGAKGVGSVIGKKYICEDSRIDGAANFPGSDSSSVNDCFVR